MTGTKRVKLKVPIADWTILRQMARVEGLELEELCLSYLHTAAEATTQFLTDSKSFDASLRERLENHLDRPSLGQT